MRTALWIVLGLLLLGVIAVAALVVSMPDLPVPVPTELRMAHVTVVEPGVRRRADQTVLIREGRVASVGPSADGDAGGPWDGLFVMPGLVDLHVHLPPPFLPAELRATLLLFLSYGVTTVRDAGSPWSWSLRTREQVASGRLPGPRVLSCGLLLVGQEGWPGATVLTDESQVPPMMEKLRHDRVDCVKVLETVSPSVASAIRNEAHRTGLRLIGHVPSASDHLLLDEVQHLTGLGTALRTRHTAALEKAVSDSLSERVSHTPTLVVLERFARASERRSRCDPACRFLPRYFETVLWDPRRIPALDAMVTDLGFAPRERFEAAKEVVGALARGGAPILAGTDSPTFFNVPGASLHEEIALLHEAGLSSEEALAAATTRAAAALGDAQQGRIEPGTRADLVLLRNDPIEAVAAGFSLDVAAVIVNGRLYTRADLDAQLAELGHFLRESAYASAVEGAAFLLFPRAALHVRGRALGPP